MLKKGDKAPDFTTVDESGNPFKLSDYLGQKVVLYFFPRDFTPGCTTQACSLRDGFESIDTAGMKVFGISGGAAELHVKFIKRYNLPFHILVDSDLKIAELYDSRSKLSTLGFGTKRVTYLINEEGVIEEIIGGNMGVEKIDVGNHAEQIMRVWNLKLS
ncbi:MAG: peroxiredoxin [Candidatus Thorarchaeota archaeon]|nr:MAG: peroxiredoxin [Candidatus Thorarchaeota archaeon]